MVEKIFEDNELIIKRFPCDCGSQGHSLDITIELADEGKTLEQCTLNLYMAGDAPLKYRLQQIWKLLRGRDGQLADFIVRPEDIPEMINVLERATKEPYGFYCPSGG